MSTHRTARDHSSNTNFTEDVRNNCMNIKSHSEARQDLNIRDRINDPHFLKKKKGNTLHFCRWILANLWSVVNDECLHSLLGDSLKDKVTQATKSKRIYGCC